jgi:PAS domain S-box-containing protein
MIETGRVNQKGKPDSKQTPVLSNENLPEEQSTLYKTLFDRMNDAVIYCKILFDEQGYPKDFIVIAVNVAFRRLTHIPEKIILGKKASYFLPILNHMYIEWMDTCGKAILTRKSITMEKYGFILNKWLLFNGYSPTKGYFAMIIKDITWRKKIEEALRQGEKKYRKLANSITDPFYAVDSSLKITYWNRASEKIMSLKSADVVGKHYFDIFGKTKTSRKFAGIYFNVMRTKTSQTVVDKLPNANKDIIFEIEVYPTGNGIAVLAKDITERKKQQMSLETYTQRLEELIKIRSEKLKNTERLAAIGETAGMIGHDIRNPLQSIIGELFLAKDELKTLPKTDAQKNLLDSVNFIEEQTLYINKIVTDLQDYAKPLTPTLQEVNLKQIMQDTIQSLEVPANIQVTISTLKPLPTMKTDASFIMRILTNLARNGIQAMEKTGGNLNLNAFPRENSIIIAVSDCGAGIPEEVKDRIFKPLFTTKSKGQGFGLAVVKKLAEALGGNVSFETKVGKGTTFIVELPLGSSGLS